MRRRDFCIRFVLFFSFCTFSPLNAVSKSRYHQTATTSHVKEESPDLVQMGYLAPARINCNGGWDVFISSSFIYWLVGQQQLDLASWIDSGTVQTEGVIVQKEKYKPGFKVSIGATLGHDDYVGQAQYTRLHMSTITRSSPPQGGTLYLNSGWADQILFSEALNDFTNKWSVELDVIDAELGRWAFMGKTLKINLFCGVKAGWLVEKNALSFNEFIISGILAHDVDRARSKSWFMGPRVGFDSGWNLGYDIYLTGSAAGTLVYQRQSIQSQYGVSGSFQPQDFDEVMIDKFRPLSPIAEIALGFAWGTYLMDHSWHIDFQAAYEMQYWFNQNTIRAAASRNRFVSTSTVDTTDNASSPIKPGDLYFHGLTFTARVDF